MSKVKFYDVPSNGVYIAHYNRQDYYGWRLPATGRLAVRWHGPGERRIDWVVGPRGGVRVISQTGADKVLPRAVIAALLRDIVSK